MIATDITEKLKGHAKANLGRDFTREQLFSEWEQAGIISQGGVFPGIKRQITLVKARAGIDYGSSMLVDCIYFYRLERVGDKYRWQTVAQFQED